jgi:glycerol-3-phosphate dehydrogenase (NAD(P)+)
MPKIGVIGGGAWGTALAQVLSSGGRDVLLWAREEEIVSGINKSHENSVFLPGVKLDEKLKATGDLKDIATREILLLVTPTQFLRATLQALPPLIPPASGGVWGGGALVLCCKGVELGTGLLPSQIAHEILPNAPIIILTGPTFAAEIAQGLPAAVTLAADDIAFAKKIQAALGVQNFRPYVSHDMIGAQLGAAIKNVVAIACGMIHGRKFGESARAALISRGLAEIARLTEAMGGKKETLMGLCGLGDLTLTCSSLQSRNFSLGAAMGEGKSADEILGPRKAVTEGVYTAKAALDLARRHNIEMPITQAVHKCVNEGVSVDVVIKELLNRPLGTELSH